MSDNIGLYWTGGVLNAVSKLPYELQREVYNLIDFDTKLTVIMDRYPTMQRVGQRREDDETEWNDIFEWFSEKELSVIYRQGYLCKLFQYNERSRRLKLNPVFVNILPQTTIYGYSTTSIANVLGEPSLVEIAHPVYDMIDNLRTQDISSFKTRLQLSLSVMQHTDVRDEPFNRYIRKVAFQLILASNVYKRTCAKARQRRELELQQLNLEREWSRTVKHNMMAQIQIEIDEERRTSKAKKILERADILRIREEDKQLRQQEREQAKLEKNAQIIVRIQEREQAKLEKDAQIIVRIQEREQAKLEKDAQIIARIQEREENIQRKQILQREMEEKRERSNQQKLAQQKAKAEERMLKLIQKTEKENKKREQTEQKEFRQQLKLEKNKEEAKQKIQRANKMADKKKAMKQKQYEHTLCYICKLFR